MKVRSVEDPVKRMVMHLTVLGLFGRAYYSKDNIGHFGLGSPLYSHFTAPIRRYSDIIVHRIIKSLLRGNTKDNPEYTIEELEILAERCSEQSLKAEKLEFKAKGAGLALMTRRPEWAGTLPSVVTRITPRGLFLVIRQMVEGRMFLSQLTRSEVFVDPSECIALKKRKEDARIKQILRATDWQEMLDEDDEPVEVVTRLGDKINVQISSRDYVEGTVNVLPVL
ncbi:MAG TPA: RNB domain-containing ribonuclease, partial [Candidatus Hodarchaeales archaeon]|nr:RNB domain-containing ribonuclease [Candidatus Hodarchaeales archaeon]